MTQNDSLFQASMTQMTQNDSHFEVFSFEMTQNDSFPGHKCPTEHPLSVADEPPATPPSPQNDTPSKTPPAPKANTASSTPALLEQGRRPGAIALGYLDDAIPFPFRWFARPRFLLPAGLPPLPRRQESRAIRLQAGDVTQPLNLENCQTIPAPCNCSLSGLE